VRWEEANSQRCTKYLHFRTNEKTWDSALSSSQVMRCSGKGKAEIPWGREQEEILLLTSAVLNTEDEERNPFKLLILPGTQPDAPRRLISSNDMIPVREVVWKVSREPDR